MAQGLRERGFSAPKIYSRRLDAGLLLLEDLGTELVVAGDPPAPIVERYAARRRALGRACTGSTCRRSLPIAPKVEYRCRATTSTPS